MTRKKARRFNGLLCTGILILLMIFAFAMYVQWAEYTAIKNQLENSIRDQREAVAKNIELVNEIAYHDSDAYIEKIAREQLGMVKPNEIVFRDKNK